MSYHTWHEYGYGFCFVDIKKETIEKIEKHFNWEDFNEDTYVLGERIAEKLNDIGDCNGFLSCTDYDDNVYVIYSVGYPWHMTDKDKEMTEQNVENIIISYMKNQIGINDFDKNVIGYQEVENGG